VFLTSVLDGEEWSASHPGRFTSCEIASRTQWVGGWVGHRTNLDAVAKRKKYLSLPEIEQKEVF